MAVSSGVKTVGVIDIGSNLLRLVIAQVFADGRTEILEQMQRGGRLGQESFQRGRLDGPTMQAAIAVLREFQQMLQFYQAQEIRAVATSAVREAANGDTFLDRIFMATGLDVEAIAPSEESRLTVSAVRQQLGDTLVKDSGLVMVVEVGGGSTLVVLLDGGEIVESHSLRLGSIRLQEVLSTNQEMPGRAFDILKQEICYEVNLFKDVLPLDKLKMFIAVGGDARFAARQVGKETDSGDLYKIRFDDFEQLTGQCSGYMAEELVRMYGLPFADAQTLNPALMVYRELIGRTGLKSFYVSTASMRDGLLLDHVQRVTGHEDEAISKGVLHSALSLAEKYRVEITHAKNTEHLAMRLFDELQTLHGLASRHKLLLRVATLVHESGTFINTRAHHKHTFYLLMHSEIFGLTRNEIAVVAHVARYHRRSSPKPSHTDYMTLPRERRMIVSKLAALLRVADALDTTHTQNIKDFQCDLRSDECVIFVATGSDITLERRSLEQKTDLFEDIFGLKVRLEDLPLVQKEQRRARPVEM